MDLAPIHTIHGFCQRALGDHALEAGQPLRERDLLENEAALRREVALDFWREHSRDTVAAATLGEIWSSPEALADSLRELVVLDVLQPAPRADDGSADAAMTAARKALAAAFREHGEAARALLRKALAEGSVNKTVVKDEAVDPVWIALDEWLQTSCERDPATNKLENFASDRLQAKTNKGKSTPVSPLFDAIQAWQQCRLEQDRAGRERRIAIVHAARDFARQRFDALKRERGLLGFDDMIRGVAEALDGPDGDRFAHGLQSQYAVALLDEFQDTDARQWAIFHRLFSEPAIESLDAFAPRALFLIGDPKQAIYRFRGGDVFTYLAAERQVDAKHHLARNFRSRPMVLESVQALFELSGRRCVRAGRHPFRNRARGRRLPR